jgi:hypothetical protein
MMNVNKPLNIGVTFDGEGFIARFKETNCVMDRAMTTGGLARMLKAEIERFYQHSGMPRVVDPESDRTFPAETESSSEVYRESTISVMRVTVIDPDSKLPVEVEIRKCVESGAMVGIDGSYLEQEVDEVRNPYNPGLLDVPSDEDGLA